MGVEVVICGRVGARREVEEMRVAGEFRKVGAGCGGGGVCGSVIV